MARRIELETDTDKPLLDYGPFDVDGVPRPCFLCAACSCPLALKDELVSKSFSGSGGPAFLFRTVFNTVSKKPEDRLLLTGRHVIANLVCLGCDTPLGWTYIKAYEPGQRYKEGKHILEKNRIIKASPALLRTEIEI